MERLSTRASAARLAGVALIIGATVGCIPEEPTAPTTTVASSTTSVPDGSGSTTIPDGAVIVTGVCQPVTVPPGDARSTDVEFGGGAEGYGDAVAFEVLDVSLEWDAVDNEDVGIVLSSSDDSFSGLVVGPAGAGASVKLREGAATSILDAEPDPESGRLDGELGPVEGFEVLDAPTPEDVWTVEVANLSDEDEVVLRGCSIRMLVR